jgi:glycosyltransferase involved in cell wall biosynthesis
MKLLSLNTYNYRRGGADAVFLDHDELFRNLGWETAVFAMQHPKNEPSPWAEYFVDELEFGRSYNPWQKLVMASKVIYSFEARKKLGRLLDKFIPDVAHAHCIYHHLSPSVLSLLRERDIPTVMTAHDLKLACPAYKMLNRDGICERCKHGNLLHVAIHRCVQDSLTISALVAVESATHKLLGLYRHNLDKIVTPSRFFRAKLMEWGWPEEKLAYIPNFVRVEEYTPQFSPGDYFLYFGRLAPEKGVDTLITAATQANVKLRIAGTGPDENRLKTLAISSEKIEFMGYRSGENLKTLLREAKAIVLPSQWYENAPMSILEAYACGKPVIAARIGGIPEMLQDGQTGYLFESGNVEELATHLTHIHELSDSRIIEMGQQARNHVTENYTPNRYMQNMLRLYQSLGVNITA